MYATSKAFLSVLSLANIASSQVCDTWTQVGGTENSQSTPSLPLNPLSNSTFTSSNSSNPVANISIYMETESESAPFNYVDCPEYFTQTISGNNTYCTAYNIKADEFTDAIKGLSLALTGSVIPKESAQGYGEYISADGCPVSNFNNAALFSVARRFEESKELTK